MTGVDFYDIDVVLNGNRLTSTIPAGSTGGEWDAMRAIPRRLKRRMIGAGMLRRGALDPDELADRLGDHFHREFTTCDAVDWYVDNCWRELRHRDRTRHRNVYARRNARVQRRGYRSLWHYRVKELGHARRP